VLPISLLGQAFGGFSDGSKGIETTRLTRTGHGSLFAGAQKNETNIKPLTHLCRADLRSVLRYDRFAGLFAPRTLDRLSIDVRVMDRHYGMRCRLLGGESVREIGL